MLRRYKGARVNPPISVLLVEDNDDDVAILRRYIRRCPGSWRVEVAYSGAEALQMAVMHRHDVAILDYHLPDQTGITLINSLRETVPELPLVMLTGNGDERLAVEVMKAGAYDYLRKVELSPELLYRTLHNVLERARLEQEVREAHHRLREWAIRDGLTGLFNHRHFQELLQSEYLRAERYQQPLSCMMLDLDHFKSINDTYGHPFGDEVLKAVAATLAGVARQVDVIARYGGEEFVAILPNTDLEGALKLAERIRDEISAQPFQFEEQSVQLTVSIGVATSDDRRVTGERDLVKQADAALYQAKWQGRNRVCVIDPALPYIPNRHRVGGGLRGLTPPPLLLNSNGLAPLSMLDELGRRSVSDHLVAALKLFEARDPWFRDHSPRVAALAASFGASLGLPTAELGALKLGAELHDLGRLAISDQIWLKPGPLTEPEWAEVKTHPARGARLLEQSGALSQEALIARHHHERWDGAGYPDGLAGEAIPPLARLTALADAFVAMTAPRPWRAPMSAEHALAQIMALAGEIYDPLLVPRFVEHVRGLSLSPRPAVTEE